MSTPLSTPIRQAKLGITATKSLPLANEYKKLLNEQHHRLWTKHQQDLDLLDDIRSYVKARLSIERDYTSALMKLGKQHSSHIAKKFTLLYQCDPVRGQAEAPISNQDSTKTEVQLLSERDVSDSRLQKRLASNGQEEPSMTCTLYKVWSEHIARVQATSKSRAEQFEQLIINVDKLKDIRSHKASVGKKCLDTHMKRIHEDLIVTMVELEKSRKLYHEDESQAKKARENEEKIKKKRSGLLTKFTDLQAKKEKTSAQREANDIQSTQARNDYIMALAAANAHLQHYYQRDLSDFIHLIDDGVLDQCKISMATLSEWDINSLRDAICHAQYWSKMINSTSYQKTNAIFLDCEQSSCLRDRGILSFEPCNDDPIQSISLEHNADYALQHEIDKWFTWFKKECRNLNQLIHQLEVCQRALAEGKKTIELNGQGTEDVESKIIDLKQQIRKTETAKLKAQARLKVIKEGGMQIEEWSSVESEIRADMLRVKQELEAKRAKEVVLPDESSDGNQVDHHGKQIDHHIKLQVSRDSDDSDEGESINNLASVSRSASNIAQKQQNSVVGYSALTDPSLVWQDDYSSAWGGSSSQANYNQTRNENYNTQSSSAQNRSESVKGPISDRYDELDTSQKHNQQQIPPTSMTVQSSSPLSAVVDGMQSLGTYQVIMNEAYKSDYECDYNRNSHLMRSTASSADTYNQHKQPNVAQPVDPLDETSEVINQLDSSTKLEGGNDASHLGGLYELINKRVIAMYAFDKTNEDDLPFNENDILVVLEINDENWVKAENELTAERGYVPVSYIKLLDETPEVNSNDTKMFLTGDADLSQQTENPLDSENALSGPVTQAEVSYCRALYDYEPEADTYEDDGLPHLALIRGEVMRIIEQGDDDGWWLVEKESTGIRGHVPSMLVEEENEFDELDDYQESGSEYSDPDDMASSVKEMPSFEPPILQEIPDETTDDQAPSDMNNNVTERSYGNNIVTASFVIIEPTPEVESRKFEDSIHSSKKLDGDSATEKETVQGTNNDPLTDVSYSVINEEFVLEKPSRIPYTQPEEIKHHEAPTILEETVADDVSDGQNLEFSSKTPDGNYEPLSEVDSMEMPPPPAFVIDNCEDRKRESSSPSLEEDDDDRTSLNSYDNNQSPTNDRKEIEHSVNVDIDPLLRHRADDFSKQIIAEAIKLVPGIDVDPSSSSAAQICNQIE